ncbi:hypothetical protein B0H67DRAFT_578323 [Lasiosphaeris hirsuta]|uniref:Uncharacterized protein n=1 Tax=Lasiosphaeris hirsuta TaxID=260670 RepID=A0AA40AEY3_9PEZI|nr:hypothetical protein B0H67DRAFT_578323 [Lasiosphaeris hirsuta]
MTSPADSPPYSLESSFYGPGALLCWYLTLVSVLLTWTYHPGGVESRRRRLLPWVLLVSGAWVLFCVVRLALRCRGAGVLGTLGEAAFFFAGYGVFSIFCVVPGCLLLVTAPFLGRETRSLVKVSVGWNPWVPRRPGSKRIRILSWKYLLGDVLSYLLP